MKQFAILRPGDANVTREDIDSFALQNTMALLFQNLANEGAEVPGIREVKWVRSYWAPGTSWSMCLYSGPDVMTVELYNQLCAMPFISVHEVKEDACTGVERRLLELGKTEPGLIAIEARGEEPSGTWEAWGALMPNWVRSYIDTERKQVVAAFLADGLNLLSVEAQAREQGWVLHRVVEIRPEEYLGEA